MSQLSPDMQIQGSRDLTQIERVMSHPQWVMPDGVYNWLPALLAETIAARHPEGHAKAGEYKFSMRARQKAMALMLKLNEQNIDIAPPPQKLNVHVSADVETAMERISKLPPEDRKRLASMHKLVSSLATEQPPAN